MKSLSEFILESSNIKKYVNVIVVSPEKEILILRRANYMKKFGGKWGFPGGSVDDKDKDDKTAAFRELNEETKIDLTFNERNECKKLEEIKNDDGSVSIYYIIKLETDRDIKISREHAKYEWYNTKTDKNYKWMPNVFQIIQKYVDEL